MASVPERSLSPDPRTQAGPIHRVLHGLLAAAGWALFVWSWVVVLGRIRGPDVSFTLTFLALSLTIVVSATWLWAAHNARLARTKKPRLLVREATVRHTAHLVSLTESPIVVIALENGRKVYRAQEAELLEEAA